MNEENATPPSGSQGAAAEPTAPRYIDIGNGRKMFGGSFFDAPPPWEDFLTINLMAESPQLPSDLYLPIQDYSVPSDPELMTEIFEKIKASPEDVYVGCWGGIGRTGLFMSCYLKYTGVEDPLKVVRKDYNEHAVETPGQMDFLADFPAPNPPRSALSRWFGRRV